MQTEKGEMIGFIMFATDVSAFTSEEWQGDCIFTGVPKNPVVFDNQLCSYLQGNKNIEFKATVKPSDSGHTINISGFLTVSLNKDLVGSWSPENSTQTGTCLVPSVGS